VALPVRRRFWTRARILALCACAAPTLGTWAFSPRNAPRAVETRADRDREAKQVRLTLAVRAEGAGVADAEVNLAGESCRAREYTDADGEATLVGCSAGPITLTVEAPGYVRARRKLVLSSDDATQAQIELSPAAKLAGQVVDDAGNALTAVTVVARPAASGPEDDPWVAITGQDGSYSVETLPPGVISLEARASEDHETMRISDVVLPNPELTIRLRRTARVLGNVTTEDAMPVEGAAVTLAGSGVWPARVTRSAADGSFEFAGLPEGVYEVRAQHANAVTAPLEGIHVHPAEHVNFDLTLVPGAELQGSVHAAASGRPLTAAAIEVVEETLGAAQQRVQTGADGRFAVTGLRAVPQRVTVRSPGYVTEQRWVRLGREARFDLLRAASIRGRVEDADGRPVSYAELEVTGRSITGAHVHMVGPVQEAPEPAIAAVQTDPSGTQTGAEAWEFGDAVPRLPVIAQKEPALPGLVGFHCDERGVFQLDDLPPGQLVLSARKPRVGTAQSSTLTLMPGAQLEDVTIVLPRGHTLQGKVVDADSLAVPRVRVDLDCQGSPLRSLTTRPDGSFTFEAARGGCTLWARPFGAPAAKLAGEAQNLEEQQELVIALPKEVHRLAGRVLSASGAPVDGANVRLHAPRAYGFSPLVLTQADGSFSFTSLPEPPYTLDIEHPDYVTVQGLWVPSDEAVSVRMHSGSELTGSVLDGASGLPLMAADVLFQSGPFTRALRTRRDGSFTLRHVPEGAYRLTVHTDGFLSDSRTGQLGAVSSEQLIELVPEASVSGEVVDELGRTVWNAQVALAAEGAPPDWVHAVRTDHAGRFALQSVPEGEHSVSARATDGAGVSTVRVRTRAGEETPAPVLRLPQPVDDAAQNADEVPTPRTLSPQAKADTLELSPAGVVVRALSQGSALARAGVLPGDVLLRVDGEPVRSAAQARGMLAPLGSAASTSLRLEVQRNRSVRTLRYLVRAW